MGLKGKKNNTPKEVEKYELSWIGKKLSKKQASTKTNKILSEKISDGYNCKNTDNIFIEGDNLDGLKLLQKNYANKVKLIYIDPPYNTGKDFTYRDNFKHSDWCSMIYPRLILARSLLSDSGVIFISIDDNELFNLKLICDEVFGEENFINCIAVKMSEATGVKMTHQNKRFPKLKEYLLFYKKTDFEGFKCIDKYRSEEWDRENNIFLEGMTKDIRNKILLYKDNNNINSKDIKEINNLLKNIKKVPLADKIKQLKIAEKDLNLWLFENSYRIIKTVGSKSLLRIIKNLPALPNQQIASELSKDNILFFYITNFNNEAKDPRIRVIFADENIYKHPCDFWQDIKTSGSISKEGGIKYNNGKKPLKLLTRIIKMTTGNDDIILDFFAGSGTTGHAVMLQNSIDNLRRKFILIQIPENLDSNFNEAKGELKDDIKELISYLNKHKKPHFITEITKIRLQNAGNEIRKNNKNTDIGFKVFEII